MPYDTLTESCSDCGRKPYLCRCPEADQARDMADALDQASKLIGEAARLIELVRHGQDKHARCGKCGTAYTQSEWRRLPFAGWQDVPAYNGERGYTLTLRHCSCGSTISAIRDEGEQRGAA